MNHLAGIGRDITCYVGRFRVDYVVYSRVLYFVRVFVYYTFGTLDEALNAKNSLFEFL